MGLLICYDKAFPEASRSLALDGAEIIVCISAWPTSRTAPAENLAEDRWALRFNLFDAVRALENQVVLVASNQAGTFGSMRFVANAKVVGPGGDVLATTGATPGAFHLADRRPETYRAPLPSAAS